ncbi:hypothetical protein ACHAXT_011794, partial [Thalassiosira profunda]
MAPAIAANAPAGGAPFSGESAIAAIPPHLLGEVASYLAKPSRALFAAAVTAPSSSLLWKRAERQSSLEAIAILGDDWEELDLAIIEGSLVAKLSDDDVHATLICIDGKRNLRKLNLAAGINIVGHGLEALRGSAVLEKIDLYDGLLLLEEVVDPILRSIIDCLREREESREKLQYLRKQYLGPNSSSQATA